MLNVMVFTSITASMMQTVVSLSIMYLGNQILVNTARKEDLDAITRELRDLQTTSAATAKLVTEVLFDVRSVQDHTSKLLRGKSVRLPASGALPVSTLPPNEDL
jgi:hypothetical protein